MVIYAVFCRKTTNGKFTLFCREANFVKILRTFEGKNFLA